MNLFGKKQIKPLVWLHGAIKTPPFSSAARVETGVLLRQLQEGSKLALPHSRPMPGISTGCHELRITDENKIWRIMYFIDSDAIVILDVFAKTSTNTPMNVIDICRNRLKFYKMVS